ncbi:MAG TPA: hypothetical protein EYP86_05420 [Candidatus Altiarchaeales archaeon]|nr:hypothetical protein [Candidatus Altiarchaeales archaeon]
MKKSEIALIVGLIIAISITTGAISVGTAPGVYDLGELESGSDVAFRFYLMTNARNDLLVRLSYFPVHKDIYYKNQTRIYKFIPVEASEEDISSWIEIPRNPLLLSPTNVRTISLTNGNTIKANAEADIILHIPDDAEPGYHAGSISLSPRFGTVTGGGTGVSTIAVTRFIFVFKVAGNAKRDGEIVTMIGERLDDRKARISVLFKNTGTCTMSAYVSELKLYDKFGNLTKTLKSGPVLVSPGDIASIPVFWTGSDVTPGSYRAEAKVNYITGYATMEGPVEIPAKITVEKKAPPKPEEFEIPWLYILLIIIIIILIIYWLRG